MRPIDLRPKVLYVIRRPAFAPRLGRTTARRSLGGSDGSTSTPNPCLFWSPSASESDSALMTPPVFAEPLLFEIPNQSQQFTLTGPPGIWPGFSTYFAMTDDERWVRGTACHERKDCL